MMNPLLIGPLFQLGTDIISRLFPDPADKAKAEFELMKMTQDGDLKQVMAQLEINAKEAMHPSTFVAGWRPAAGWVGVLGLFYASMLQPLLVWLSDVRGWPKPPDVDTDILIYVLGGLLGFGAFRSYDKVKKVTK